MSQLNYETQRGFILDLEPRFFAEHTEDELIELGYTAEQVAGIDAALGKYNLRVKGGTSLVESEPAPEPVDAHPHAD
jgi:hypothetical protein